MLKTTCNGCVFNCNNEDCALTIPVFKEEENQYTKGYCRHKRNAKWYDQNKCSGNIINTLDKENNSLSIMVLATDNNVDDLAKTVKSTKTPNELIKQVVVVCDNLKGDTITPFLNVITDISVPWAFDNLKMNIKGNHLQNINYASRLLEHSWFLPVVAGQEVDDKTLEVIHDGLQYKDNGVVAFYKDENDAVYVATNVFAFNNMEGNNEMAWFDKVKTFDNWKEVCRKID